LLTGSGDASLAARQVQWDHDLQRGRAAVTEIPEHLLQRARVARDKAARSADSRLPAHVMERARAATANDASSDPAPERGGGALAVADKVGAVSATPTGGGVPFGGGPGGHTQRLLTVVKSGSIQEVKATPVDKVHTWPHLIAAEFVAALACTAFLFFFSVFVNAPLLQLANPNETPNPSKAPWYFLGLQELLNNINPMIGGVTLPGVALIILIVAPYIDKNPSHKPEDRKFATALFTIFVMFWAVLTIIGSFFRGPGQNFVLPWRDGLFFEL
jgi:quinol---cytochrome c reductase cytochrome c subunit, bacillus type